MKANALVYRHEFMARAIDLSRQGMQGGHGGPFGCVIVHGDTIVGEGFNEVTSTNDPTAHAEVQAIRKACRWLGSFQLTGCVVYTSCEPCPMCLAALFWARPLGVFMANSAEDAASIGFDDAFIYTQLRLPIDEREMRMDRVIVPEARQVFQEWTNKTDKKEY